MGTTDFSFFRLHVYRNNELYLQILRVLVQGHGVTGTGTWGYRVQGHGITGTGHGVTGYMDVGLPGTWT